MTQNNLEKKDMKMSSAFFSPQEVPYVEFVIKYNKTKSMTI